MMMTFKHLKPIIVSLTLLPAISSCQEKTLERIELTEEALDAVTDTPGAPIHQLAREVDDLFALEELGETRALLVIQDGKIAAERYGKGFNPETRLISWSMAKTVTSVMVGMLLAEGLLELDGEVPIDKWRRLGDPRSDITLRHLLQMRSGLRHTESGDPPYDSSEVRMLFLDGRDDMARWAEEQPLEAEPGSFFEYSSNTSVILADIAAHVLTAEDNPDARQQAVGNFLSSRLFGPLGINSMVPEFDAAGTLVGGSLMHATARDWGAFGEFLRQKGRAPDGAQIVPKSWVQAMLTPSPQSNHYGFHVWLNRPIENDDKSHPLFPERAPESVYALIGHMGQYVIVSPEQRLTVVRLGHSDASERVALLNHLADIMELYPVLE